MNQAELAQIRGLRPDGTIQQLSTVRQPTPWKTILGSPNMWFIAFGYCCFFFGTNFYLTWYPTYLREHRHLTLQALGLIGSLPLVAGMLGDLVGGSLSDLLLRRTGNARLARRAVAVPAFLLAGIFVIPAAMTETVGLSVMFLALSFFSLECVIGPAWAVPMDVGGQFSGTVTGIMDMAGALAASLTARLRDTVWEGLLGGSVPGQRRCDVPGRADLDIPDRSRKIGGGTGRAIVGGGLARLFPFRTSGCSSSSGQQNGFLSM